MITCTGERSKAFNSIERNTQRNSDIQKYIVESLDGRKGLDDGGHLFANNTGGPNELINQIPMSRELNQHGQWRELERMEEKALKEGKEVFSQRNLLYRGSEKLFVPLLGVLVIPLCYTRKHGHSAVKA